MTPYRRDLAALGVLLGSGRGMVVGVDLDAVADELYGLDPGQFTPTRTAREKEARAAGHRDLAAQIKALRKPSMSAWLANQLVRERRDQIEPLLALGEKLRELQSSVSADQLRALTQQRHRLVYAVAQEARALGHERGQTVTDAVARELEQTLHAALGDPEAADAVRTGRLVSGLQYAGFGPVETPPRPEPLKDDLAEKRKERAEQLEQARAEAQEVLDRARAALVDAEASHEEAASAVEGAEQRHTEARDRVDQIKLDLDDAEEAAEAADHDLKAARRNAEQARRAAQLAAQRVAGAEHRLAQLD